jgi:hypothetical protein
MERRKFIRNIATLTLGLTLGLPLIKNAEAKSAWEKILDYPLTLEKYMTVRDHSYMYNVYIPYGFWSHFIYAIRTSGKEHGFHIAWCRFYRKLKWLWENFIFVRKCE